MAIFAEVTENECIIERHICAMQIHFAIHFINLICAEAFSI